MNNEYQLTSKWKCYYRIYTTLYVIGFCIVVYAILFSKDSTFAQRFFAFPFIALFFIYSGIESYSSVFQKLIVTSEKLEFKGFRFDLSVDWSSTRQTGLLKHLFYKHDGIYIDKTEDIYSISFPGAVYSSVKAFIPLSMFESDWRDSELGQQIKHYAPHLLEKEKSVQAA